MQKTIKRVLIILTSVTILAFLGIFFYNLNRTYYNDKDEVGNTTGNIYNGGLFCEQDGSIYFSNPNADGSLFVMKSDLSNPRQISKDKAVFINADENYLYYIRANNTRENNNGGLLMFYNTGVFRINHNGSGLKAFTGNPGAYLTLRGNTVYFQRYDVNVGLYLYQYQIDGTQERLLIKDAVIPATIIDHQLYYAGLSLDHNINALDLSSYTTNSVINGDFMYPIFTDQYIYYMDVTDDYCIYRINPDGTGLMKLTDKRASTYNITNSGSYLYYQVDNTKNNGIYRLNLETMEQVLLLKGNYKNINVTENYVFFQSFDNAETYAVRADGSLEVNLFEAPSLSE